MPTIALPEAAEVLLHRRLSGERVDVTDVTGPILHELAAAELAVPLHTVIGGEESASRLRTLLAIFWWSEYIHLVRRHGRQRDRNEMKVRSSGNSRPPRPKSHSKAIRKASALSHNNFRVEGF